MRSAKQKEMEATREMEIITERSYLGIEANALLGCCVCRSTSVSQLEKQGAIRKRGIRKSWSRYATVDSHPLEIQKNCTSGWEPR